MGPNSTTGSSDLWQTLRTTRAIRRFDTRDVPDSMLLTCLEAATWAPSGGNQQPWRFVVLRSPDARDALAKGAERALDTIQRVYRLTRPAPEDSSTRARASRATFALHDGARDVPAAVLFCIKPLPSTPPLLQGGSIFPAMQNFLLAARSVGLGACVTGWHVEAERELREVVRIPDEWQLAALVIVGWPRGRHGPVRRRDVNDVVFFDRWDAAR